MSRSSGNRPKQRAARKRGSSGVMKLTTALLSAAAIVAILLLFLFLTDTGRKIGQHLPLYERVYARLFPLTKMPVADSYGIDVSHFQGKIDWDEVRAIPFNLATRRQGRDETTASVSISFVIVKATEGATHTDDCNVKNMEGARAAGFPVGAYHVMTTADADEQADNYIKNSGIGKGDLTPVIDLEESILGGANSAKAQKVLKALVKRLHKHYGVKPIIYCSHNFGQTLKCETDYADYPLWIARYSTDIKPFGADIWQFSDRGRIPGIRGDVDLNAFYHTRYRLSELMVR